MEKLAIFGGTPVIRKPFPSYQSIGELEKQAVMDTMNSGCLSGFYGSWCDKFWGGPKIKEFEKAWASQFEIKHAITVNSATSGLYAAMGAIGINPGDEVIVPPTTMSATVMAPLLYGGIPVFVDIDPETFCLDVDSVSQSITPQTKAILAVNLFGHPAPLHDLKSLAVRHNIILIEDNAQAPLAKEYGCYAGCVGDIGIFSLNYHKHIHTGEGGVCVTQDDDLAQRLLLIRNHGENVIDELKIESPVNIVGFNFRMTELSAAVGLEQLKNIEIHVMKRVQLAEALSKAVQGMEGLNPPVVRNDCQHVYYVWAMRYDEESMGVSRELFSNALLHEGFPNGVGYIKPLYYLPIFKKQIAIGSKGYPFNLTSIQYHSGLCPVAEHLYEKEFICFETCAFSIDEEGVNLMIQALKKVYEQRHKLHEFKN